MSRTTLLPFHCNLCASELTDNDAIFTSCGHLFCNRGCTRLSTGDRGRCDYCGEECETCSLCSQGLGLPEETRKYLFSSPEEELQQLINILAYHRLQRDIYIQNVRNIIQQKTESIKKAQEDAMAGQNALRQMELYREEISRLKKEVQSLASENQELKRKRGYHEGRLTSPTASNNSAQTRSIDRNIRSNCVSPLYKPLTMVITRCYSSYLLTLLFSQDTFYRTPRSAVYNRSGQFSRSPISLDTARELRTKGYSLQTPSQGKSFMSQAATSTFRPSATPDLLKRGTRSYSDFFS
eukprot:jgi/Galph1/344/GphlegSOOS_G5050.1